MKTVLALVLSALLTLGASAQPLPTPADLRKVTDQIMERVGKGEIEGGLALLKSRTVIPQAEFDALVGQVKLQLPAMSQRFGGSLGFEFLREDKVGENLLRYTYIHRYEKHAVRWVFYCYRSKGGWVVNSFRYDDNLPALFPG